MTENIFKHIFVNVARLPENIHLLRLWHEIALDCKHLAGDVGCKPIYLSRVLERNISHSLVKTISIQAYLIHLSSIQHSLQSAWFSWQLE